MVTIEQSNEVDRFCEERGLRPYASAAMHLARSLFSAVQSITTQLRHDPEETAAWVLITVETGASRADADDAYRRYVRAWVRQCPPTHRSLVRLSYRVV